MFIGQILGLLSFSMFLKRDKMQIDASFFTNGYSIFNIFFKVEKKPFNERKVNVAKNKHF